MSTSTGKLIGTYISNPYHAEVLSIFPPTAMSNDDVRRLFVDRRVSAFVILNVNSRRFTTGQDVVAWPSNFRGPRRAFARTSLAAVVDERQQGQGEDSRDRVFDVVRRYQGVLLHGFECFCGTLQALNVVVSHFRLPCRGICVKIIMVWYLFTTACTDGR